jgi:7-cyano-7-deazaguanine tRNA-ribosyltransferase
VVAGCRVVRWPLVALGVADGSVEVWRILGGPFMANAWETRRYPPGPGGLWVDSGGYQVMVRGLRVGPGELVERYRRVEAEYYLSLDVPPRPGGGAGRGLLRVNVENYDYIRSRVEWGEVVPVVHVYEPWLMAEAVDEYRSRGARVLAMGGTVPGLLNRGVKRVATLVAIAAARRLWRGWLHVLGAGSPVMAAIVGVLGADSADTTSWRTKAAYGKVILPGAGERYVGSRRIRYGPLHARPEELAELERFLRRTGFPLLDGRPGLERLLSTFQGRALVNAWVLRHSTWRPRRGGFAWLYRAAERVASMSLGELEEAYRLAASGRWREALQLGGGGVN